MDGWLVVIRIRSGMNTSRKRLYIPLPWLKGKWNGFIRINNKGKEGIHNITPPLKMKVELKVEDGRKG